MILRDGVRESEERSVRRKEGRIEGKETPRKGKERVSLNGIPLFIY